MSQNAYPTYIGNSTSLPDFVANLQVLFNKGFTQTFEDQEDSAAQFYQELRLGAHEGITRRVEEPLTGRGYARIMDEGDNVRIEQIAPGYYKDVTVARRSSGLDVTWFFEYHNKYPEQIAGIYRDVGLNLRERMELDMQLPFGFGTATTYTDMDGRTVDISPGDGLQLWYTAHTLTGSSITTRNRLANNPQVSDGSVESAMTLFNQNQYTNSGMPVPGTPDTIVVTRDQTQYHVAMKIVNSMSPQNAPNSGVFNPLRQRMRVVRLMRWDYTADGRTLDSTKLKYWMVVDSSQKVGYVMITEDPNVTLPTVSNGGILWTNEDRRIKGTCTYEPCVLNPRFAVFSSGDGTA